MNSALQGNNLAVIAEEDNTLITSGNLNTQEAAIGQHMRTQNKFTTLSEITKDKNAAPIQMN